MHIIVGHSVIFQQHIMDQAMQAQGEHANSLHTEMQQC